MKTFKDICEEYRIEKFDTVICTVTRITQKGRAAVIDNTDGRLEIFYKGGQQNQGEKVLLSVSRIDEEARKIFGKYDSCCDYGFAA